MKQLFTTGLLVLTIALSVQSQEKIQVLNFGSFHMGFTTDGSTTAFDEHDKENQARVHEIARKLVAFKPTVIIIETDPSSDEAIQKEYAAYIENPNMFFKSPSEIELLAYELGRLSGATKIYGIDHKMGYNYAIGRQIENTLDPTTYENFFKDPFRTTPEIDVDEESLPLLEKLQLTNHNDFLDFLINVNADILTHVGKKDKFQGADEAAKFYKRNLRMYSNLNKIDLKEDDRVFILMGAAHTAFFRDFLSRSPKYIMVDTFEYLK